MDTSKTTLHQSTTSNIKLELDPRFECSICLEYLKEAVLTSCGHRFCSKCIDSWLKDKNKNYCPIDELVLNKEDIFIDNYTRREILENNINCPYTNCSAKLNIPEYETHIIICKFKPLDISKDTTDSVDKTNSKNTKNLTVTVFPMEDTQNAQVNDKVNTLYHCKFYRVGCREIFKSEYLMKKHHELKVESHLELLYEYCNRTDGPFEENVGAVTHSIQNSSSDHAHLNGELPSGNENPATKNQKDIESWLMKNKEQESKLWEPSKNKQGSSEAMNNTNLMKLLYERIVLLEQGKLELEIRVKKLEEQMIDTNLHQEDILLKLCNGVYYWKINDFVNKLKEMKESNQKFFYSPYFYTSLYGYRFCSRVNISRENPEYLSLFIHLVEGAYDSILSWPFMGKIIFTAISSNSEMFVQDELYSDTNLDSMKRPLNSFNKRAFGIINFIKIGDIINKDNNFLIDEDLFIIKIQIQPC